MPSAMSIQVLPFKDAPKSEVYALVDQAIAVIQASGLRYMVGPFETTVEGELDELLNVAKAAHQAVIDAGCGRVFTYIKLATAPDLGTSEEKVEKFR